MCKCDCFSSRCCTETVQVYAGVQKDWNGLFMVTVEMDIAMCNRSVSVGVMNLVNEVSCRLERLILEVHLLRGFCPNGPQPPARGECLKKFVSGMGAVDNNLTCRPQGPWGVQVPEGWQIAVDHLLSTANDMLQSALVPGSGSGAPDGDGGSDDGLDDGRLNFFNCRGKYILCWMFISHFIFVWNVQMALEDPASYARLYDNYLSYITFVFCHQITLCFPGETTKRTFWWKFWQVTRTQSFTAMQE